MKRLAIVLLALTPWALYPMEPEEKTVEKKQEIAAQGKPSWVRLVEEVLPGGFSPSSRVSQVLAQELLRRKPQLWGFIFGTISLPFRDFEVDTFATSYLSSIQFNAVGDKMVITSKKIARTVGIVEIWEVKTGKRIRTFEESEAISNDSGDIFIIFSHKGACLWNAKTDEFIALKDVGEDISTVTFSQDGGKVAIAYHNYTGAIWDVKTGKLLHRLPHGSWSYIVLSRAGDTVATQSSDGAVMIRNIESGKLLHTLKDEAVDEFCAVGFNATGDTLVTTNTNSEMKPNQIWDLTTGRAINTLPPGRVLFSQAGDKIAIETPYHVSVWSVDEGNYWLYDLPGRCCGFSPAGDKVVTQVNDEINIWDVETGEKISFEHKLVSKVVFNVAGDKVLTIKIPGMDANSDDVRIWDAKMGKLLHGIRGDRGGCWAAAFNPAGDGIAVHLGNRVRMVDLKPLFESLEFLTEITPSKEITPTSITHRQVALLLDMYDIIEHSKSPNASGEVSQAQKHCTFDFNNYSESIWDEYNALPEVIRRIFDPYVTKPSSPREEQVRLGS